MAQVASHTFPLQDLASNQAKSFQVRSKRLALLRRLAAFILFPVGSRVGERVALHYAHRFAQTSVWFRGAESEVDQHPWDTPIDPEDSLRSQLDSMEAGLQEIAAGARSLASSLRRSDGQAHGRMRNALDRLAVEAHRLAQDVRHFKGAVQAHDANLGALGRARRVARSASELESELDRCLS